MQPFRSSISWVITPLQTGLLGGILLSFVSFWMFRTALNTYVASQDGTPFHLSIIESAYFLPSLFFTLIGGQIADSDKRRNSLIILLLIYLALQLLLGMHILLLGYSFVTLALITAMLGVTGALKNPVTELVVKDFATDNINHLISGSMLAFNLGRVFGPIIVGLAAIQCSKASIILVAAAINLPLVFILLYTKTNQDGQHSIQIEPDTNMKRPISNLVVITSMYFICSNLLWTTLPFVLADLPAYATTVYGYCFSVFGLGAVAAAPLYPRLRRSLTFTQLFTISALFYSVVYVMFLSKNIPLILASVFLAGISMTIFGSGISSYILEESTQRNGRDMSILITAMNSSLAFGSLFLSALVTKFGIGIGVALTTIILVFIIPLYSWRYLNV